MNTRIGTFPPLALLALLAAVLAMPAALAGCHERPAPSPFGVRSTVAAGGDLYVLNEALGRVIRLDPQGAAPASAQVGPHPQGLAATGDGSWVVTLSPACRWTAPRRSTRSPSST
jgi:hypothetical protein